MRLDPCDSFKLFLYPVLSFKPTAILIGSQFESCANSLCLVYTLPCNFHKINGFIKYFHLQNVLGALLETQQIRLDNIRLDEIR